MTHSELVGRGARWLERSYGCKVVLSEQSGITGETPDIIGWKSRGRSVLVEVKVSRGDFLADARKPFRMNSVMGMGAERYYMAPKGLLKPQDLPQDWGLIEATAARFKVVVPCRPRKDLRSDVARTYEMQMLITALYRVSQRLAPANLWEWLEYSNVNTSMSQMQAWVGRDDHELHILAQRGFEPVVDPAELPEDEASGEPWCPKHEQLFDDCQCIGRCESLVEYETHKGLLYGRREPDPPYHPDDPLGWLLRQKKREDPDAAGHAGVPVGERNASSGLSEQPRSV